MTKQITNIRIGIYLCDCDGKVSKKVDLNKVKAIIQSKEAFEYIRAVDVACTKDEREKIVDEIDKYTLNRLLVACCNDPFIMRQFLKLADEKGINRYNVKFVDLSAAETVEAAASAVNDALAKLHLMAEIGYDELTVTPDVLVIGAGYEAAAAARAIAKSQPVVQIDNVGTRVIGLDGFPGAFTVRLLDNGQTVTKDFGAIVLALGAVSQYDKSKYGGVELGADILSLSQFNKTDKDYTGKKVSFALGKADEDSLLSFAAVLKAALKLKEKGASEISILYEDMKVCADGLEQDYELARKKGVNFLKYSGEFQITRFASGIAFKYREPFLADPAKIVADYIVLAEDFVPAAGTGELAEIFDVRTGPGGFFQKDNVHFLPIKSNRAGIFFVGSCHGPIHGTDLYNEIEAVLAEVSAFAKGKVSVPSLQPKVEAEKCAVCLTCYRCCPHHAIEIVHGEEYNNMYNSAARMNPLACQRCGVCAAECPGKAIQLPLYSDQEIFYEVKQPARIVAYACENSGYLASEFAKALDPELQKDLQIVEVPCSGKIDIIYLLKALENGADGVMLCVCHKENCKFVWGNDRAEQRKERAQQILNQVGLGERIDFVRVAANQGNQFNTAVKAMAEKIRQSGTNPGKVVK
jgi:coenzyme F420-reducing hydrogenase delta subunit/Pyruvate/2-oxoacid:ferredoxin oxidoreductase delta subunit